MGQDTGEATPSVHLVAGPTGVGKSRMATSLAKVVGAPVVVADRIQCFTDLATTSARAGANEPGVRRLWLGDRTVPAGDYPAAEAARKLIDTVGKLSSEHQHVIIEGGSISLLQHVVRQLPCLPWQFTTRLVPMPDRDSYLATLTDRARAMLAPVPPGKSLLEELAAAWQVTQARGFVASVNGLEAALDWCEEYSIDPAGLGCFDVPEKLKERLAHLIAVRHLEHGMVQDSVFTDLFRDWPNGAEPRKELAV